MIVAIDGHAGAGKSSLGKRLAYEQKLLYIDTGALYRAIALAWSEYGKPVDAEHAPGLLQQMKLGVEAHGDQFMVILNGENVTDRLRAREVGEIASRVAKLADVRNHLTALTRSFVGLGDLVVDGRDIGTVVFPEAELKIFLTASPQMRAKRRYKDLAGGQAATVEETQAEIQARDERDSKRALAPLTASPDAIVLDTTELSLEAAYEVLLKLYWSRKKN